MAARDAGKIAITRRERFLIYSRRDGLMDRGLTAAEILDRDREPEDARPVPYDELMAAMCRAEAVHESVHDREPIKVISPRRLSTAARVRQSRTF